MTENDIDMPSIMGAPSTYCMRSVFANKIYFDQVNFVESNRVNWAPVNNKNNERPIAKELFRKTDEIMKAIVAIIIVSIELNP